MDAFPDGNMWSDNGSGAVLWLYVLLIPICVMILVVLLVLRPKFMPKEEMRTSR